MNNGHLLRFSSRSVRSSAGGSPPCGHHDYAHRAVTINLEWMVPGGRESNPHRPEAGRIWKLVRSVKFSIGY